MIISSFSMLTVLRKHINRLSQLLLADNEANFWCLIALYVYVMNTNDAYPTIPNNHALNKQGNC